MFSFVAKRMVSILISLWKKNICTVCAGERSELEAYGRDSWMTYTQATRHTVYVSSKSK